MHDPWFQNGRFPFSPRLPGSRARPPGRNRPRALPASFLFAALLFFLFPDLARAVQPHGEPEGLVAHQLGHLLFAGGMLFLLVRSRLSRWAGPGWYRFKGFLWLAIAWNFLTFIGHFLHLATDEKELVTVDGRTNSLVTDSFSDLLFYVARLDHLVLLPALCLLALALRQWIRASEGKK